MAALAMFVHLLNAGDHLVVCESVYAGKVTISKHTIVMKSLKPV